MPGLMQLPIGPESPLSLWFLAGSLVVLGTTLAAGWKIVAVIRTELAAYVQRELYELHRQTDEKLHETERKALMEMLTHMHGCMHEVKAALATLQRRAARKDEEDSHGREERS